MFREEKRTFPKVQGGNTNFFLQYLPNRNHCMSTNFVLTIGSRPKFGMPIFITKKGKTSSNSKE
jgi:hypothetical protein